MNTLERVNRLNEMIIEGKVMEAFEEFYAEDVVMQENNDEPTVGKDANRERELKMMEGMKDIKNIKSSVKNIAINDNVSFCEWTMELTFKDDNTMKNTSVSRQLWNDEGKIVHETFFHKG